MAPLYAVACQFYTPSRPVVDFVLRDIDSTLAVSPERIASTLRVICQCRFLPSMTSYGSTNGERRERVAGQPVKSFEVQAGWISKYTDSQHGKALLVIDVVGMSPKGAETDAALLEAMAQASKSCGSKRRYIPVVVCADLSAHASRLNALRKQIPSVVTMEAGDLSP